MIITNDDDLEYQAHREMVTYLVRQLRFVVKGSTHETYVDVAEWLAGLRIFFMHALNCHVDVEIEVLSAFLVIRIRIPHAEEIIVLTHVLDYGWLRYPKPHQQALLKAESAMLFRKIEAFLAEECTVVSS